MRKTKMIALLLLLISFTQFSYSIEFDDYTDSFVLTEDDYEITFNRIDEYKLNKDSVQELVDSVEWETEEDENISEFLNHEYFWLKIEFPSEKEFEVEETVFNSYTLGIKNHGHTLKCFVNGEAQNYVIENVSNVVNYSFYPLDNIQAGDIILLKLSSTLYGKHDLYLIESKSILSNLEKFYREVFYYEGIDFLVAFIIFVIGTIGLCIFLSNRKKSISYVFWFSIFAIMLGISHSLSTDVLTSFLPLSPLNKELLEVFAFDSLSIILILFYTSFFKDSWRKYFYSFIFGHLILLCANLFLIKFGLFKVEREVMTFTYPAIEYAFIWLHLTVKSKKKFPTQYFKYAFTTIAVTYILQAEVIFGELTADISRSLGLLLFFIFIGTIPVLTFIRQAALIKEQNIVFRKFVPNEFLNFLSKESITQIQLGDQKKANLTVLFADIRSFTAISEKIPPSETFTNLNRYLALVGPIIRKHNGFIDKYIGDAVMALFPDKSEDAIMAAKEMLEVVKTSSEVDFEIGIGIHSGDTILGIIGEEERIESTVISDTVNTASRLESLTKKMKCPLIFSEAVAVSLDENDIEYLGESEVRGKDKKIKLYSLSSIINLT